MKKQKIQLNYLMISNLRPHKNFLQTTQIKQNNFKKKPKNIPKTIKNS